MLEKIKNKNLKIGLIGLGYVGLPLAVEFGKYYDTIGFDVKKHGWESSGTEQTSLWKLPEKLSGRRYASAIPMIRRKCATGIFSSSRFRLRWIAITVRIFFRFNGQAKPSGASCVPVPS